MVFTFRGMAEKLGIPTKELKDLARAGLVRRDRKGMLLTEESELRFYALLMRGAGITSAEMKAVLQGLRNRETRRTVQDEILRRAIATRHKVDTLLFALSGMRESAYPLDPDLSELRMPEIESVFPDGDVHAEMVSSAYLLRGGMMPNAEETEDPAYPEGGAKPSGP